MYLLIPFCKLKTVQVIWIKLYTVVEHNETMYLVQEPRLCIFLKLFPFCVSAVLLRVRCVR